MLNQRSKLPTVLIELDVNIQHEEARLQNKTNMSRQSISNCKPISLVPEDTFLSEADMILLEETGEGFVQKCMDSQPKLINNTKSLE